MTLTVLQFWSIYVGCSSQYKDAVQYAIEQIDLVQNMVRRYPNDFELVDSGGGDVRRTTL